MSSTITKVSCNNNIFIKLKYILSITMSSRKKNKQLVIYLKFFWMIYVSFFSSLPDKKYISIPTLWGNYAVVSEMFPEECRALKEFQRNKPTSFYCHNIQAYIWIRGSSGNITSNNNISKHFACFYNICFMGLWEMSSEM